MKILIVRTDKLGDFITALPTCKILKQYNKNFTITVCVAPLNRDLAEACDFIDDVIIDDTSSAFALAKKLKPYKFDLSITLFSNTKVALAQFLARIPKRIAPATKIAQLFYTHRIKQRRSEVQMAEYEYNIALAQSQYPDIKLTFEQPLLKLQKEKKDSVVFHIGYGGSSEANITIQEYFILANIVKNETPYTPIMSFGPGDEQFLQEAKKHNEDIELYESKEGLIAFAKFLSNVTLFVSTSTGTYHLAALVGTPTMTFFGNSLFASVKRWKAVSDESMQHPFMLSNDTNERQEQFEDIKRELITLLEK